MFLDSSAQIKTQNIIASSFLTTIPNFPTRAPLPNHRHCPDSEAVTAATPALTCRSRLTAASTCRLLTLDTNNQGFHGATPVLARVVLDLHSTQHKPIREFPISYEYPQTLYRSCPHAIQRAAAAMLWRLLIHERTFCTCGHARVDSRSCPAIPLHLFIWTSLSCHASHFPHAARRYSSSLFP